MVFWISSGCPPDEVVRLKPTKGEQPADMGIEDLEAEEEEIGESFFGSIAGA